MPSFQLDYLNRPKIFSNAYSGKFRILENNFTGSEAETYVAAINHPVESQGGHTALMIACYGGYLAAEAKEDDGVSGVETVRVLIKYGANPLVRDNIRRSALHIAANVGDFEVISELLSQDGVAEQILATDIYGRTAFHALCMPAQDDNSKKLSSLKQSLELLLNKCSNYEESKAEIQARAFGIKDKYGFTAYDYAHHYEFYEELADVFKTHQSADVELNTIPKGHPAILLDYFGRTPLMQASFVGNLELLEKELSKGEQPMVGNAQAGFRNSLHLACNGIAKVETVEALLAHRYTNPIASDASGATALHYASFSGLHEITYALLRGRENDPESIRVINTALVKTNINGRDLCGRTALHAAVMSKSRMLVRADGLLSQRMQVVQLLLDCGINHAICDNDGFTALQLAQRLGHTEVADALSSMLQSMPQHDSHQTEVEHEVPESKTCSTFMYNTFKQLRTSVTKCVLTEDGNSLEPVIARQSLIV